MLSKSIKTIFALLVLTSCAQQNPVEPVTAPPLKPELITIDGAYAEQLLRADNQVFATEFGLPHRCELTASTPAKADPSWIEPNTIWPRIRQGLSLQKQENRKISAEFNWYKKHPAYMRRVSERSKRYIHYVVEQLELQQLPLELALLPIVESAYDPFAYSHGRASGMWQFIPSTGRMFKLHQNWWYDGRRDIVDSTRAAIAYLKQLNKSNKGDWLLALAAYNSGQGTVNKAIRKNRKKGKPTDFWSLDLPAETRSYVPKLLALAKIIDNPKRYGIELFAVPNKPYFAAVDTQSQIDLAQAAEMAEMKIDELYRLNPGFNRWATTPSGPHRLLVPVANKAIFDRALLDFPAEKRLVWQRYTIVEGDVLAVIARRFNTDVSTIKQINGLRGNMIRTGKSLMIPVASKSKSHYSLSAAERLAHTQNYQRGDKNNKQIYYRVKSGESLWTIARQHNVTVAKLARWNKIGYRDVLRVGQQLSIWLAPKTSTNSTIGQRDKVLKKVGYKVRSGDSLARIADRFNLRIKEIIQWNSINPKHYLRPGQRLTLYIDIMNAIN